MGDDGEDDEPPDDDDDDDDGTIHVHVTTGREEDDTRQEAGWLSLQCRARREVTGNI